MACASPQACLDAPAERYQRASARRRGHRAASGACRTTDTIPARNSINAVHRDPVDNVQHRVLIVEDEATLRESCASVLQHEGYDVLAVGRGDEARDLLQRRRFDIVLLDLNMSQVPGMELLETCLKASPDTLVVMMTGNPNVESSIEALRKGAWDYLPKPFTATHLQILLGRARHLLVSGQRAVQEERRVHDEFGHSSAVKLLGRSPAFLRAIQLAEKVARTDASVFLTGESGSGKEVIAQFVHHHSRRSARQMVAVNCAALPETLLESEMFGHVKGAFTGAVRDKPGLLETADAGTFFLDELTEMSQPIQAKLLRVIQDGIVRRVGSESPDARVDVRFIAATNRDPREAVENGVLRKDLYYRLSVVPIHIPPLRERVDDIAMLAEHFRTLYWKKHRDKGTQVPTFSPEGLQSLRTRPWAGNVRELQNVMEHAVVLLEPGQTIAPDDLPHLQEAHSTPSAFSAPGGVSALTEQLGGEYHIVRDRILTEFELQYLSNLIDRAGSNMSRAAKLAGVDRTTLYRLMEKHGLQRDTVIKAS
jgi:DNA-binding NtrC family response regulator